MRRKTLGTSYSNTTNLLAIEISQNGVLMSTPCCQILTPYRLVVSEYEVPKDFFRIKWGIFFGPPCSTSGQAMIIPRARGRAPAENGVQS